MRSGDHVVRLRSRGTAIPGAALLIAAVVAPSISAASAAASSRAAVRPVAQSTTIKPDYKFFEGKTITVVVAGSPGSNNSNYAVDTQTLLQQHLGATVNIEYIPGADAVQQDIVGNSSPDGLTIGITSFGTILNEFYTNVGTTNFPFVKATFLGGGVQSPFALVSCLNNSSPTFAQLRSSGAQVSDGNTGGFGGVMADLLFTAYSIPHRDILYSGPPTQASACQVGNINVALNGVQAFVDATGANLKPGMTPMLLTSKVAPGLPEDFLNGYPTLATIGAKYPQKTALEKKAFKVLGSILGPSTPGPSYFGPRGIPAARVLALTDALSFATKTASVKQALVLNGLSPKFLSSATDFAYLKAGIKYEAFIKQLVAAG